MFHISDDYRSRGRPLVPPANRRVYVFVALLVPLLGGCGLLWRWTTHPISLSCKLQDGSEKSIRVDPRLQQVQELDPGTGEVRDTITTNEPPKELGSGIIDESSVTVSQKEIRWSQRMYRPEFVSESHIINLQTLSYRGDLAIGSDYGAETDTQGMKGTCRRVETLP
ncbi:hypothetical protein [Synechococcus sp. J7-Johnson]|uniref:hypothetical protein n=1 Tax=Synechococcus sp. J7-Johnson TaxID=2823737 RepID=UPI0020CFB31B|nr:hypothetical protein [Synechococcus sp. J7-Johnson]